MCNSRRTLVFLNLVTRPVAHERQDSRAKGFENTGVATPVSLWLEEVYKVRESYESFKRHYKKMISKRESRKVQPPLCSSLERLLKSAHLNLLCLCGVSLWESNSQDAIFKCCINLIRQNIRRKHNTP